MPSKHGGLGVATKVTRNSLTGAAISAKTSLAEFNDYVDPELSGNIDCPPASQMFFLSIESLMISIVPVFSHTTFNTIKHAPCIVQQSP